MRIFESARIFFRGPAWWVAWPVSAAFAVIGAVQEARDLHLGSIWMWLFFGSTGLVIAAFLSFHRERMHSEAKKGSLPAKIDALHREGLALVEELSAPAQAEEGERVWTLHFGPPGGWWEKVEDFDQRSRDLLIEYYPGLLHDYNEGFNRHRKQERENKEKIATDQRAKSGATSSPKTVFEFATDLKQAPMRSLEASLTGLAEARRHAGASVS